LQTSLELGYQTGDLTQMLCFDEVYEAFLRQYFYQLERKIQALYNWGRRRGKEQVTSPFLAGTLLSTLKSGSDPLRGGYAVPCWVVFSGSIPTVADSLAAIKKVVFEDRFCSPAALLDALRADFEGHEELRRRCLAAPKFGNDDEMVDSLAADIARRFCDYVVSYPTPTGKPLWPALYDYLFIDHAKILGASPDGRRLQEPICEHYSPTPGRARSGPTAVIRSAARGPLGEACGSSVFHVSLPRTTAGADEQGKAVIDGLLRGALALGVAVMNIAIYDAEQMRDARLHPERHEDLIVRVWGFSARFVDLSDAMQEHIIQRAIVGGTQA
jgi:formate C-acetyltransferase